MNIYPSILTDSVSVLQEQLDKVSSISSIETVQIDIIDGEFADDLTLSPIDLIGTDFGDITLDFHLMVNEPVDYVFECKQIENVRSVIGQIERMTSQKEFIDEALELNILPGLSLDLYTPVESIHPENWDKLRIVQIMGNKAGIQGQEFNAQIALSKVKQLVEIKKSLDLRNLEIIVDIGVNDTTIEQILKAGASGVVVGSFLWKSDNIEAQVQKLEDIIG